jgi:tetratricopeptide (TPR) repeat protein
MGGAYTALAGDSNALFYNPAGLAKLERHELTLAHNQYVEGLTHDYLGLGLSNGLGLQLNYLRFAELTRTTYSKHEGTLGSFSIYDLAAGVGYARTFFDFLSVGAGAKFLQESNDDIKASGYAFDAGILASVPGVDGLSVGAAAQNMGRDVTFMRDKEKLPLQTRLGAAYRFNETTTIALDGIKGRRDSPRVAAGAEIVLAKIMAVRLGFNGQNDAGFGIAGGVGWLWKSVSIDYAFMPYGDLGLTHRVGVTMRWGSGNNGIDAWPRPRSRRWDALRGQPKHSKSAPPAPTIEGRFAAARREIQAGRLDHAASELVDLGRMMDADDSRRVLRSERLGYISLLKGDAAAARRHYSDALSFAVDRDIKDINVADAYEGMGRCLLIEGNTPYALRFFKKAFELSPSLSLRKLVDDTQALLDAQGKAP